MKKTRKILLALTIITFMSIVAGCSSSGSEEMESNQDFEENVKNEKSVIVDGEEFTEYEMNDGLKIQAPSEE